MKERAIFEYADPDVQIIRHEDGSLSISVSADYGDSEIGWGQTEKTVYLDPDLVDALVKFLS